MPTITTKDGVETFTRTGGRDSRLFSAMVGRCRPMIGTRRCCSSCIMAIA